MNEVKAITGARTKTAAVRRALEEYIRAEKRRELAELAGEVPLRFTNRQLESLEEESERP